MPTMGTLPFAPQVDYSSYGIITDKINWTTLTKTFVADSAYTHLVVGCFKPLGSIQVDTAENPGSALEREYQRAYYYISKIGIPDDRADTLISGDPVDTTTHIFPNSFTPNNDGNNDVFRIVATPGYLFEEYSLSVFNRFGELVFYTENSASGWDGKFKNIPQEIGAYFYMSKFKINGKLKILKGDLSLLR
ncbi:MAG: gliding motility-associated C-terminal domain-containing protein [Taibaiella sp.]|nr:gliding motility-associated C-terminal domain-containing protein [Taibaiella sp.]